MPSSVTPCYNINPPTIMKRFFALLLICLAIASANAQWKPAGDNLKTDWGTNLDPSNVLPEYPRPIMEREKWQNLNGLWNYAIRPHNEAKPSTMDGEILVPFAVESSLSGVGQHLGKNNALWYEREFTVPSSWKGNRILLHFGAVDWKAEVWINDMKIGEHKGGYTPFSFDITPSLCKGANTLTVKVWDPSSEGWQPRGKQSERPWILWYTTVSGIWQTVWMEPVAENRIESLRTTPDIDSGTLTVKPIIKADEECVAEVKLYDGDNLVASGKSMNGMEITLPVAEAKLWSPENPFLYDMEVTLSKGGKVIDRVKSYAAMRKFSMKMGDDHIIRLQLNNEDYFQFGTLDQGYWPDGLYTAPTDEALAYDIIKTKELGYNMIRKHIKVEPARWYTHCDRIGMIVWQDMPSGGETPELQWRQYFKGVELERTAEEEENFRREWKEIIDFLYSHPSIGTWVTFNEGWGQFKTQEIAAWTKQYDPSRLVDQSSGGNHYPEGGDMLDLHNYPEPQMYLFDYKRANVLGEYGGVGYTPAKEHCWKLIVETDPLNIPSKTSGMQDATDRYEEYINILKGLIAKGYTAAVYTQITDLEMELNGMMTYDRKLMKLDVERVRKLNQEVCNSFKK